MTPTQGYEEDNKYYNYVMKEVFNNTIKHFDIAAKNNLFQLATPTDLLKHLPENDEMIKCIWDNLDNKLKDMNFPFLKLHGDLITRNILINKEDHSIKYIDFENSDVFVFFYDILKMVYSEHENDFNTQYRLDFAKGKYDIYLDKIFGIFGLKFKEEYRLDYLNIFFINFYKQIWYTYNKTEKLEEFNRYNNFYEEIKSNALRQ